MVGLVQLSQNQGHFLREGAVSIDPGTILRLDETIVKSGGESVEPPLSGVSPAASQLSQSYEFRAATVNAPPPGAE